MPELTLDAPELKAAVKAGVEKVRRPLGLKIHFQLFEFFSHAKQIGAEVLAEQEAERVAKKAEVSSPSYRIF